MLRADLRTPSTLLVIRNFGANVDTGTFTPAHDIVPIGRDSIVSVSPFGLSQAGSLPVPGLQSITLPSNGGASFRHTGDACFLHTVYRQTVFIEKNSSTAETMYDLVSPDDKAKVFSMNAGSVVQVKEGDVMVMMTSHLDTYSFDPDRIAAVVVALPALTIDLPGTLDRHLAATYNRVKDFLACHAYNAFNFTLDARLYAAYRQNMGMNMQALNEVCVIDFPRSYWGLPPIEEANNPLKRAAAADDGGVTKKRKTKPTPNKRALDEEAAEPQKRTRRARS